MALKRNNPYWLSDGIYPKYSCFVQSIINPYNKNEKYYSGRQEGRRKYIERNFGVLQSKFHIIVIPNSLWRKEYMNTIITCCVILHSMVVKEKRPLVPLEPNSREVIVGYHTDYYFNLDRFHYAHRFLDQSGWCVIRILFLTRRASTCKPNTAR